MIIIIIIWLIHLFISIIIVIIIIIIIIIIIFYSLRKTKVFSKNTFTFPINWQRCNSPFDLVTHVPLGEKLAAMGSFNWAIHTLIKLLCNAFDSNLHIQKCDNVNIVMIWTVSTLSKKISVLEIFHSIWCICALQAIRTDIKSHFRFSQSSIPLIFTRAINLLWKCFSENFISILAALALITKDTKQRIPVSSHTSSVEKVDIWEPSEEEGGKIQLKLKKAKEDGEDGVRNNYQRKILVDHCWYFVQITINTPLKMFYLIMMHYFHFSKIIYIWKYVLLTSIQLYLTPWLSNRTC